MKRWRISQPHPEDRFEPDDEAVDAIRDEIRAIESRIEANKENRNGSINDLFLERQRLRIDLAERLYGK